MPLAFRNVCGKSWRYRRTGKSKYIHAWGQGLELSRTLSRTGSLETLPLAVPWWLPTMGYCLLFWVTLQRQLPHVRSGYSTAPQTVVSLTPTGAAKGYVHSYSVFICRFSVCCSTVAPATCWAALACSEYWERDSCGWGVGWGSVWRWVTVLSGGLTGNDCGPWGGNCMVLLGTGGEWCCSLTTL